jgi:hypothetical protein
VHLVNSFNGDEGSAIPEISSMSMGITLTTSTGLISGQLISAIEWFRTVEKQCNEAASRYPGARSLAEFFKQFADDYAESLAEYSVTLERIQDIPDRYRNILVEEETPSFIHLKEARLFSAGQTLQPGNGILWRGRLSEVNGWCLGSMSDPD